MYYITILIIIIVTFQGTAMNFSVDLMTLESGEMAPRAIPPMHSVGCAATPFKYLYFELGALLAAIVIE